MSTKYRKNIVYKNNILCFGLNTFKASNHGRLECFDKKSNNESVYTSELQEYLTVICNEIKNQ
ncbi:hypothetical protein BACPEC_00925 [[Bacteroides] pectinophilus ATCC 43243]|uniref:Uncharacterized protein n=1 Tax=[Bacteroides] pectinophilus ATCC 43243 TaxID=483218 RepID=B7AQG8_9FIRM|nr:hypothetical protein BACPEC_00925 [[Bacteroides] pectinophilus ATCC 43243]